MLVSKNHFSNSITSFSLDHEVTPSDITICYAVRCSDINPWVLERIEFALTFYSPKPNIMIVDFGSKHEYSIRIKELCINNMGEYIYVEDFDTFSLAKARNMGFLNLKTDFLLLADIDYVYERDFFSRLSSLSNRLNLVQNPLKVLTMPIYHVNKEATEQFEALVHLNGKDRLIGQWETNFLGSEFGQVFEFVAPYSNSIFLHRKMFDLSGGYCDEFKGHGSEDFEFLIRLAKLTSNIPIAGSLEKDFYGPLKPSFWGQKDYLGFRRYLEAFTLPCELLGLKAFHLWHEKPSDKGYWTQSNDWKRERFNTALGKHSGSRSDLLRVDYITRSKTALCIFSDKSQWGYFLPLRIAGYKLDVLSDKNDNSIAEAMYKIEKNEVDRIFIFNPYMKSHVSFRGVIEVAKKIGIKVTVIERGGLPNSIYFSEEVAYGDHAYKKIHADLNEIIFSEDELSNSQKLIADLATGEYALESMEEYSITWNKHALLRMVDRKKIFIPLQLRDDMAVNYFTEGFTSYASYEDGLQEAIRKYPNILFIIKEHPLSKYDMSWTSDYPNVITASQSDNIHALIDISDCVALYNSGVGLLAMAHNKPLYNIGNAYYGYEGEFSIHKNSMLDVANEVSRNELSDLFLERDPCKLNKFFAWLFFRKYSWFTADDEIRDFSDRKSHGYKNINISILNLDGNTYVIGERVTDSTFSNESYLNWHLNLNVSVNDVEVKSMCIDDGFNADNSIFKSSENIKREREGNSGNIRSEKITIVGVTSILLFKPFLTGAKRKKLNNNPEAFFKDSKSSVLNKIGRLSFK